MPDATSAGRGLQLGLVALLSLLMPGPAAAVDARPNVLFIITDDMNGYGFYGERAGVKVPHLDRFKASALTFKLAYCAAPSCVPSRAATFSGRFPHHTGSYLNGSDPWDKAAFANIESLPEVFKRGGYNTWGAGKLFHAKTSPERDAAAWDNKPFGGGFGPFVPEKDRVGKGAASQFWGCTPWEGPDSQFPDVKNSDAAIEFLRCEHSKPFLLMFGQWRPHTPFTAPKRFFDLYDLKDVPIPVAGYRTNDLSDVPAAGKELAAVWGERFELCGENHLERWREFVRGYHATTSFADWTAGRVIEALDQSRYASNTIVIFWSDNGYHCGEKNHWEKSTLWEKSALTPLAIRVPGLTRAGQLCQRPVSAVDLFPTLVELCGLPPPPQPLDGQSLRPLLANPETVWTRPALTAYEENTFSVRTERFRYIRYADGAEELYDHNNDPHEFENLAGKAEFEAVKIRLRKSVPEKSAKSLGGRKG